MGNTSSAKFSVCGSSVKKEQKILRILEGEENRDLETNIVQRNKDNYFSNKDYEMILEKYPLFKEWVEQSANAQYVIINPNLNKIKWREAEVIGRGSYGRVVMGLDLHTGSIMAVKQVQLGNMDTSAQQERVRALESEMDLLSKFTHRNIVRYHGCHKDNNTLNIFLEYISGGTIATLLEKYGPFNENLIRLYTRQILEGLEYLHVRNAIHRDIKGANVLVDNSGVCKLADFGTAKRISKLAENDIKGFNLKGTVLWMAPEIIKQTSLTRFCDIWSVGCTVIEMATGKPPWTGVIKQREGTISTLYQIAQTKTHPPIPKHLSPEAVDFLGLCFRLDPYERPNVLHLIRHKFVSGVEIIYHSPTSKLNTESTQRRGAASSQIKPINQAESDYNHKNKGGHHHDPPLQKKSTQGSNKDDYGKTEHQTTEPETLPIKVKSSKVLAEVETEASNRNDPNGKRRTSHMANNTIHQSTKPNYTIVPKPLGHANSLKSNKETSTEMESLDFKTDANHKQALSTEPGNEYHVPSKVDLKLNTKVSIRSRLSKHNQAPFLTTTEGSQHEEDNDISGRRASSSTQGQGNGVNPSSNHKVQIKGKEETQERRPSSRNDIRYFVDNEIVEEEREDQVYTESALKEGYEHRRNIPFEINQENENDLSESRDSDREPSMNAASALKISRISYGGAENSNISGFGAKIGANVHDQSSRLSYRKEKSIEHIPGDNIFMDQKKKDWRVNSNVTTPKAQVSGSVKKEEGNNGNGNVKLQDLLNQQRSAVVNKQLSQSSNKVHRYVSEDDIVIEELRNPSKKEENEENKVLEIDDLKKFNLLDDLDKFYNQLESRNLEI